MIRVALPYHLRLLASVGSEVQFDLEGEATIGALLDALEDRYPMLCGTIREHGTRKRRPFLRYYACDHDYSLAGPETPLPAAVVAGDEPFLIIGGIAGG